MASTADALTSTSPGLQPASASQAIERLTNRLSRRTILLLAVLLTVLIGVGDRLTGVELPFTILYLLPIGIAAWWQSERAGVALSALATASVALSLLHDHVSTLGIAWNLGGAAVLFVAASWVIAQLRAHIERERAMRRLAVDQLRHAERLNVIGTLAAGVAHELGTPLNVISACAEWLAETSHDELVHRRTRMILAQVTKTSAIIRRLLDFGHRGAIDRSRVELGAVAASATEMIRSTASKRGCTIYLDVAGPLHVSGNAAELEQVVSNLILNGVQAMDRGALRVRVVPSVRGDQPVACVEVEDQGCGIPAEHLSRIFDPFFTTKGVGEGTGLGLSVSYGIVRDHDGSIEVSSKPGKGSRFTVVLPRRD